MHPLVTPGDAQSVFRMMVALGRQYVPYIRLALNQTQPLGNSRFMDTIEQAAGQRREPKPRGWPRKPAGEGIAGDQLPLQGLDR